MYCCVLYSPNLLANALRMIWIAFNTSELIFSSIDNCAIIQDYKFVYFFVWVLLTFQFLRVQLHSMDVAHSSDQKFHILPVRQQTLDAFNDRNKTVKSKQTIVNILVSLHFELFVALGYQAGLVALEIFSIFTCSFSYFWTCTS